MRILLTGDYFYDHNMKQDDFENIKKEFISVDFTIINYEGTLKSNSVLKKAVNLSMSDESLNLPKNSILCLSNNHILDFGIEGHNNTIESIKKKQLGYLGLESKRNQFDNFKIIIKNDIKVCIASFGWLNEECVLSQNNIPGNVNLTKQNIEIFFNKIKNIDYDKLIIYVHYGYEYEYYPLPLHVSLFREMIDLGADFIYSSHSHIIQPYEIYNDKYIFYGLGNFYFASRREIYPENSDEGLFLELEINNDDIKVVPKYIKYDRNKQQSLIEDTCDYFSEHHLNIKSFNEYSLNYATIRTRKKNPRPILYANSNISNYLKFTIWKLIVDITGALKIRQLVKKILGWN
jgi:hypothetical protein